MKLAHLAAARVGTALAHVACMRNASIFALAVFAASCAVGQAESGDDAMVAPDQSDTADPEQEGDEPPLPDADEAAEPMENVVASGSKMRVCNATFLNQRTGPGTSFAVVQAIASGAEVSVLDSANGWVRHRYDGKVGFSAARYLCAVTVAPDAPVDGSDSESVGKPYAGSLRNGVRIGVHAGYVVAPTGRGGEYGTAETIAYIQGAFTSVRSLYPDAQRAQVRDISVAGGGRPAGAWPHRSHQSGRDVDITYFQAQCSATQGCPLRDVPASKLAIGPTWALLEYWLTRGVAYRIFIDASLHASLRAEAVRRGHAPARVKQWFSGVISHAPNHLNHMHVRFVCADDDARCSN